MPWLDLPARAGRRATLAQAGVAALSGLAWVLASPPIGWWPLGWVAAWPLLWLWTGAGTARRAGWLGGVAGLVTSVGGFHWVASLTHDYGGMPWPLAALALLALAAWQAIPMVLAGRAAWWARAWAARRGRWLPMAAAAPVAVVAFEQVWPVAFPYQLAISQVPALPVIQVADLLGAPAITALLLATSGALADLAQRGRAAWRPAAVVSALVAAQLGYGAWRLADVEARRAAAPRLPVGLVQANEPMFSGAGPGEQAALLRALQVTSAELEAAGAKLLVWPEASYPARLPRDVRRDLPQSSPWRIRRGFTAPVVVGLVTRAAGRSQNVALALDGDEVTGAHAKVHLMIGTEANPLVDWFPSLGAYLPAGFVAGDGPVQLPVTIDGAPVRLGPLICVEDVIPRYARALAAGHPQLLVNLTNDTWFGTSAEPWQHRALAALRAVEVRGDMVRAVNTGPSGLVEATGRLGPHTPVRAPGHPTEGIVVEAAVMEAGHTMYVVIGDALAWLCVALTALAWVLGRHAVRRGAGR